MTALATMSDTEVQALASSREGLEAFDLVTMATGQGVTPVTQRGGRGRARDDENYYFADASGYAAVSRSTGKIVCRSVPVMYATSALTNLQRAIVAAHPIAPPVIP